MEQQVGTKHEVPKPHQVVTKQQALRMLETYFGYTSFRPAQEAPIASLLRNEDVIGIMPTGAGKSICFQIPALCKAGLTIVFSPLISLMKDQVDGLLVQNIPAALINSTLTQSEFNKTMYEVRSGKIKLLYIAPERLSSNFFVMYCARYRLLKSLWTKLTVSLSGGMILDHLIASSASGSIHCLRDLSWGLSRRRRRNM